MFQCRFYLFYLIGILCPEQPFFFSSKQSVVKNTLYLKDFKNNSRKSIWTIVYLEDTIQPTPREKDRFRSGYIFVFLFLFLFCYMFQLIFMFLPSLWPYGTFDYTTAIISNLKKNCKVMGGYKKAKAFTWLKGNPRELLFTFDGFGYVSLVFLSFPYRINLFFSLLGK